MVHVRCIVFALLAGVCSVAAVETSDEAGSVTDPRWQAGVFLGAARLPHYRGSSEYKNYLVPIPFGIYRGDILKAGRGGVRSILFNNVRFDASISFSGNPPVNSDDKAREGMPDLPPLIEAGPALKWWPVGKFDDASFFVELAARGTMSVDVQDDFGLAYEGWRSELSLNYRKEFPTAGGKNWKIGGSLGCYAADERYHRYFYEVDERFATALRPAYDAKAGYGGTGLSAWISKRLNPRLVFGVFGRVDDLHGAVFEDSPLVDDLYNFTGGAAFIWTIFQSSERVPRDPAEAGE